MTEPAGGSHKSSLGLDASIVVIIAYFGGGIITRAGAYGHLAWLVPMVVFVLEKRSRLVRLHAMQSVVLSLIEVTYGIAARLLAAWLVLTPAPTWGALETLTALGLVLSITVLVLRAIATFQGLQYREYRLPVVGQCADRMSVVLGGLVHRV